MQPLEHQPVADDRRLRQIIAENADGIIVVDAEGRVRFLNPAAEQLLARPADALLGELFGFPLISGDRAEIDVLHPQGDHHVAEMRVVATEWDGVPAHLISLRDITEHRRAQEALRHAEAFNWAILNSLTVHIAVLDEHGTIIAVNDAWREFAQSNGDPNLRATGVGANYFQVCENARGPSATEAELVLTGMQAVLRGELPVYELEYPCHSPTEERWFLLRVLPLQGAQRGLVVAHTDITEQRRAARAAAEAEELRQRLQAMERELRDVDRISRPPSGQSLADASVPLRRRNPEAFREAVHLYTGLVDEALKRRAYDEQPASAPLRELGERLGAEAAGPRDIVEIHLAAIRAASAEAPVTRQQAYLEEGRLLVLELMGHLAAYYRSRTLGLATLESQH